MANEYDKKGYDIMWKTLKDIEYMHGLNKKGLVKPKDALQSIGGKLQDYNAEFEKMIDEVMGGVS